MPDDEKGEGAPVEGLAGGPGPTPPGFDDGTPRAEPPRTPGEDPPAPSRAPEEHDEERRTAGPGGAARADPEEPDPS